MSKKMLQIALASAVIFSTGVASAEKVGKYTLKPGHASLKEFLLPDQPPHPKDNKPTAERVSLGKMLYFDTRLSRSGGMACSTCHNPSFGYSDGLPRGVSISGTELGRASPTVINTAYNSIQMWDGRKKDLEDQAMGPMQAEVEMHADLDKVFGWLEGLEGYRVAFEKAYPGEKIDAKTFSKAIASFERTIVSNNSPFDKWVKGDAKAMTKKQVKGFKLFLDEKKGNCAACHSGANFTDNSFHNVGLASQKDKNPDVGRYKIIPIKALKFAFKTPTLRNVEETAPYFHDGSAANLKEVMKLYARHGDAGDANVSAEVKKINLSDSEMDDVVAFMRALTTKMPAVSVPLLPKE